MNQERARCAGDCCRDKERRRSGTAQVAKAFDVDLEQLGGFNHYGGHMTCRAIFILPRKKSGEGGAARENRSPAAISAHRSANRVRGPRSRRQSLAAATPSLFWPAFRPPAPPPQPAAGRPARPPAGPSAESRRARERRTRYRGICSYPMMTLLFLPKFWRCISLAQMGQGR